MKYDLVIKNGNIISFDPDIICKANIGISDGIIQSITKDELQGKQIIDAKNDYVVPGFIDFHSHVNGRIYSAMCLLRQGVTTTIGGERYFDASIIHDIKQNGFIINHGFYISYSFTLRRAVGLLDYSKKASLEEIDNMILLAERFLNFGVKGIHIGLEYAPGTTEEELLKLLCLAKKYNKISMIHLRNSGTNALKALDEIIRITKQSSASINILHVMYTAGLSGILEKFLDKIDKARSEGCDISADTGLYSAFPTYAGSLDLSEGWKYWYKKNASERDLMISSGVRMGKFCTEEVFHYLRQELPMTLITAFLFDENQIPNALKAEYMMVSANSACGPHLEGVGHPESSGTFPKLIGEYVRDKHYLSLVDAIKKLTYLPASRIGIKNKGNMKPGMDADITIFNYDTINAKSQYVGFGDPNAAPDGIESVIVNGHIAMRKGTCVLGDALPGKLIT